MFDLKRIIRPNILNLKPYSSARDEYQGEASVYLDANENPYPLPYSRYPDPLQWEVKRQIASLKGVDPKQILLGNGSDEPIDLLYRCFCDPQIDNVVAIAPSYGMYEVCADINNVAYRRVPLIERDGLRFQLDGKGLLAAADEHTKVIFICSPNNPTANAFPFEQIAEVVRSFGGIVAVDEAYIDFSSLPSLLTVLNELPNLVVLQTLSKAWGSAGIRLGMAFASPEIIGVMNKVKYPYNVNQLTQNEAVRMLENPSLVRGWVNEIIRERKKLIEGIRALSFSKEIYPSDANFILVKTHDANLSYGRLLERGIIVRNRHKIEQCADCLRITIGTPDENALLLDALQRIT